jgi:hypothetical protein
MGLNPSNAISEEITGRRPFPNLAGMGRRAPYRVDAILANELAQAGINVYRLDEIARAGNGKPQSVIVGALYRWHFQRAWYYWIAEGPGIPVDIAMKLHTAHGTSVRVDGHCGCPSPLEWSKGKPCGHYHVDNQEGLNALAETIRFSVFGPQSHRTDAPRTSAGAVQEAEHDA